MFAQTVDLAEKLEDADGRNAEILLLVEEGWSYTEIAQALSVTPSTVAGVVKRERDRRA